MSAPFGLATGAALAAGAALDAAFGDPRRWHPVAGFGRAAGALESRIYRPTRGAGAAYTAICVGSAVGLGRLAGGRAGSTHRFAITAAATWAVLGARSLGEEALAVEAALTGGDIDRARELMPRLCGRDPASLDEAGLIRATVESVAENTSDAVVAPLLWGAIAGPAGLLGYRAVNTLDAMIGHRSERYEKFGWAAARLDDVANVVPARLTGLLAVAAAPLVGGHSGAALDVMRADGGKHPSPNSGRCEAAFAGALDVRLGGTNIYGTRVEHRPLLGTGGAPQRSDIGRAVRLERAITAAAVLLAAWIALILGHVRRSRGDHERLWP